MSGVGTGAAQVQFSPKGRFLVVTEKATNLIDTYVVGHDGLAGAPNPQPSNGVTPSGFDFGLRGDLIVSEAFGGPPSGDAAASSYRIEADGTLRLVSGSVGNTDCCVLGRGHAERTVRLHSQHALRVHLGLPDRSGR